MYNNKKSYWVTIGLTVMLLPAVLTSCKKSDWYDIKSSSSLVVPKTTSDFQALLDNPTMSWNYPGLGEIACDDQYITDANFNNLTPKERNAYTWSHNEANLLVLDWGINNDGTYARVYYTNLILDGLKNVSSSDPLYNDVKGQALFQRAQNFYQLSQVYAPFYDPATANNELGIPLRLESDVNIPSTRSTLKQTYDQIIADLTQAASLLPDVPFVQTRGSKASAYGMLARVYLSMENYERAGFYANESLKLYSVLLDYNSLSPTITPAIPLYNPEVIFHASIINSNATSSQAYVNRALYDSYDNNDLRKSKFFLYNPTLNIVSVKSTYFSTAPFSGIATDEMYLIRAESYARAGNPTLAMADLNTLLVNRFVTGTYVKMTAASADDALVKVLTERRKELIKRGLRWSDLRRLNRDPRFVQTFTRVVAGKTYTLEPGSYKYTFPLPDDVINKTGMPQNKGW